MQKPDLIEFEPETLAKSGEVNYNFEQMNGYVSGTSNELKALVNSAIANLNLQYTQAVFTGKIEMFAGDVDKIPEGWLLCDGRQVDREEYKKLYEAIGVKYGAGNGVTTFNLPNYIGRFLEGATTAGTRKEAGLPNITGSFVSTGGGAWAWQDGIYSGAFYSGGGTGNYDTAGKAGSIPRGLYFNAANSSAIYGRSNTVQPASVTVLYIIKT